MLATPETGEKPKPSKEELGRTALWYISYVVKDIFSDSEICHQALVDNFFDLLHVKDNVSVEFHLGDFFYRIAHNSKFNRYSKSNRSGMVIEKFKKDPTTSKWDKSEGWTIELESHFTVEKNDTSENKDQKVYQDGRIYTCRGEYSPESSKENTYEAVQEVRELLNEFQQDLATAQNAPAPEPEPVL